MKILQLELKGYRRLSLNNIERVCVQPEAKVQLILGTNGSGKSSLLKEMSALPGSPSDFEDGGYKRVVFEHRGAMFETHCTYGAKNRFSFKRDGEELNPSGTASMCRDLVKQHTNLTPEIHALMTGELKFHTMSVADRRAWFTKISHVDYTYALQMHSRIKTQWRDLVGAIKLSQNRLAEEKLKILTETEQQAAQEQIAQLYILRDSLIAVKDRPEGDQKTVEDLLRAGERELAEVVKKYLGLSRSINPYDMSLAADLPEKLTRIQVAIEQLSQAQQHVLHESETAMAALNTLEHTGVEDAVQAQVELDARQAELQSLRSKLDAKYAYDNPTASVQAIAHMREQLNTALDEFEVNELEGGELKYTFAAVQQVSQKLQDAKASARSEQDSLLKCRAVIKHCEHLRDHDITKCPQCSHAWSVGYSAQSHQEALKHSEALSASVQRLETLIAECETYLTGFQAYKARRGAIETILAAQPAARSARAAVLEQGLIDKNPRGILVVLEQAQRQAELQLQIEDVSAKHTQLEQLIALMRNEKTANLQVVQQQLRDKELSILEMKDSRLALEKDRLLKQAALSTYTQLNELSARFGKDLNTRREALVTLWKIRKTEYLAATISSVAVEIARLEQAVSKVRIQKALVADIENQVSEMQRQAKLLNYSAEALSPSEGLIAQGMMLFINAFTAAMNKLIAAVWLYPLEIMPVLPDEQNLDLDYKFKLKVNDDHEVADIAQGSFAMQEVINLAFRITAMSYLGLQDFPLFFDEFSSSMDKAHRASAHQAVMQLSQTDNGSQIFLVSHYEEMYASFTHADITCLDARNVSKTNELRFNLRTTIDMKSPATV